MSINLSAGPYALVTVIDTLRSAERPMSIKRLAMITKMDYGVVNKQVSNLKDAGQVTVYRICDTEYYDIVSEAST